MSQEIRPKRRYNSARRQAQALETRQQILEAARKLLIERGYTGTTIEVIAQEAGVAVETVYATFGSKRTVLAQLVDVLVLGDQEPTALLDRPGPQAVRNERDQRRQVRLFAHDMRTIMGRVGPIFGIVRTAAETEPEIAVLLRTMLDNRLRNITQFVVWVAGNGPLRDGLTVSDGADIAWTISSAEVHRLLTVDRAWPGDRYEEWLADTLVTLLLPPPAGAPGGQAVGTPGHV